MSKAWATDDNQGFEIKAAILYQLTPESIIRGDIELSAADGKELLIGDIGNYWRQETKLFIFFFNLILYLASDSSSLTFPVTAVFVF